ncbi:MAG: tRNA (guanine(46)-N(7))-methyltransferase TrmB [Pseudobdellovibrionaceae bacterium]
MNLEQPQSKRPPKRPQISSTLGLPKPNAYALALNNEFAAVAFDEVRALANKGRWRQVIAAAAAAREKTTHSMHDSTHEELYLDMPLDLEVGTGNGLHFAHYAAKHPDRLLVGLELKYKPLIQSIRRAQTAGCKNAAVARFHAFNVDQLFTPGELNNVIIHFPDPWVTPRKPQNRFVCLQSLDVLFDLQKPGSIIEFKTDSREYFLWALEEIEKSKYKIEFQTLDLHKSEMADQNFITAFEKIFMRQGIEINYIRLRR